MNVVNLHKRILCSFLFLGTCVASSFAQSNQTEKLIAGFVNNISNHLHEKVYVHTDRSSYLCGEILWFKAYVTNAANNEPLSLSKVAYIEILNKEHQPVLQGKVAIESGSGNGSFTLPLSMESGNYELRAYTNWMKNDSADHYFRKIITIINTTENLDPAIRNNTVHYAAAFFPEGGNLVNGLNSLVAFKINDEAGKGVDASGVVVDNANDTVASFQTEKFGMGRFFLTPETGKEYVAIISLRDSTVIKKDLPAAIDNGYVMHLEDEGNNLKVTVSTVNVHSPNIYLIAQNNQQVDLSQAASLQDNVARFIINKSNLKEGVSVITLFNENRQPVCERLYFKRPQKELVIHAKADKPVFDQRDKVNIDLSTVDESGKSIAGNLSASVYRLDSLQSQSSENIYTYLWLTSNLKGFIENPDYYFKNDNAQSQSALDNLLLTQGWRTFNRKYSDAPASSFNYVPENGGHIVMGKVTNETTGQPVAGVLVYLSVPGKRVQLYGCVSDAEGLVHFDMKNFYGANQVVLQTNTTTSDSSFHLELFSPFSEEYTHYDLPALHVSEDYRDDLEASNLHMEVSNAYHEKDLQKLQPLLMDTLPFYVKPYKTYLLDDYTRFITVEEVMREYVAEVNVVKRDKKFHFNTFNYPGYLLRDMQPAQVIFNKDPLILLDGVPVFDVSKIMAYDPLKIRKLDVVAEKYIWGPIVSEGIVSFTTYKGNLPDYSLNPHDVILDYDGLQKQRIFYSPDYSVEKNLQSRLPDFRDVLFWSPTVKTNDKGTGAISFYTGDVPGKYLVVLQGLASNGDAGSKSFILNVGK